MAKKKTQPLKVAKAGASIDYQGTTTRSRAKRKHAKPEEAAATNELKVMAPPRKRKHARKEKKDGNAAAKRLKQGLESFEDGYLRKHLERLLKEDDNETLRKKIASELSTKARRTHDHDERNRLVDWAWCYKMGQLPTETSDPIQKLGTNVPTIGLGSNAKAGMKELDEVITSCEAEDRDRKGYMLSHFYYRSFLENVYKISRPTMDGQDADNASSKEDDRKRNFKTACKQIWKNTGIGIIETNTNSGRTHEPCATSLIGGYLNKMIASCEGNDPCNPVWASEFTLFGSGPPRESEKRRSQESTEDHRKGKQVHDGKKQPRCDGLLSMPDPLNGNSLRPLVMMEAKLSPFGDDDDAKSRSNACDAFSMQRNEEEPWPLLVFRWVIDDKNCNAEVLAVVPVTESKLKLVYLWDDNSEDCLYYSVMASVLAAREFRKELMRQKHQLLFCRTLRNIAIQDTYEGEDDEHRPTSVYKSFIKTEARRPNLEMIHNHVDGEAELIDFGDKGCILRMKYVGPSLKKAIDVNRFVDIGKSLARAHEMDMCHGDIRVDNMMLGGENGVLIDWDLGGKDKEHLYPGLLQDITDGKRHPDVVEAIRKKSIGNLALSKDHDWFSLRAAMSVFKPQETSDVASWEKLIEDIFKKEAREKRRDSFFLVLDKEQLEQA